MGAPRTAESQLLQPCRTSATSDVQEAVDHLPEVDLEEDSASGWAPGLLLHFDLELKASGHEKGPSHPQSKVAALSAERTFFC